MAVVRCMKGLHFYDDDKFSSCPHCKKAEETGQDYAYGSDLNSQVTIGMEDAGSNVVDVVGVMEQKPLKEHFHVDAVDEDVTVAMYSASKGNDFITGWLVCVDGPEKGRDYRIYHGINKLGRGDNMDIVIKDDVRISREKVCDIVYEMKKNKFYVCPSINGMIYMNGKMIGEPKEIVTGDRIVIGDSTFEFVAFCRGDKKWE
ncbi:MAG: FHA domain-containing protein [Eubacterium sp.]|nr:FHA domain-containing protein [Eubacterium sp.]